MDYLSYRTKFSYGNSKIGIEIPITLAAQEGRTVGILAKVDTGASFCIFKRERGEELGLDIEHGEEQPFSTTAGHFIAYGHFVNLSFLQFQFESFVYFAREYDFSREVLGLQGWLDKLRVGIVHHENVLYFSGYDD